MANILYLARSVGTSLSSYLTDKQVIDDESLFVVRKMENIPTGFSIIVSILVFVNILGAGDKPKLTVTIDQCGEL